QWAIRPVGARRGSHGSGRREARSRPFGRRGEGRQTEANVALLRAARRSRLGKRIQKAASIAARSGPPRWTLASLGAHPRRPFRYPSPEDLIPDALPVTLENTYAGSGPPHLLICGKVG